MRNINYLKKFDDFVSLMSKDEEVSKDEINFMIDQFFFDFKESLEDPRMPTIKITNFGTFKTTIGKLQWHINICNDKLNKGIGVPEVLNKRIEYLTPILDRLKREKAGESTWKEWRDKSKQYEKKSKSKKQKVEG